MRFKDKNVIINNNKSFLTKSSKFYFHISENSLENMFLNRLEREQMNSSILRNKLKRNLAIINYEEKDIYNEGI